MATCQWCGRSGIFLSLTTNGLCGSCNPAVVESVLQSARVVQESLDLVDTSKKLDTRISRCDVIIQHAKHLAQYEERGIPTIEPAPSQLIVDVPKKKDEIIASTLEREVDDLLVQLDPQPSATIRTNKLLKLLGRVRGYLPQMREPSALERIEARLLESVHTSQLTAHLEAARKAEFKGNKKKAIEHYYDALYFVMHDDVADNQQNQVLKEIRDKLRDLGVENIPGEDGDARQ